MGHQLEAFKAHVVDVPSLSTAFGSRGLSLSHFSSRAERHQANGAEELYLLRRYLFTLAANEILRFPFTIEKHESPDFLCTDDVGDVFGIEITEATSIKDQREMTLAERTQKPSPLGKFGGRYQGGATGDAPERDATAEIMKAVHRKSLKARNWRNLSGLELLIYCNSNASRLCDTSRAFVELEPRLQRWFSALVQNTAIHRVSVILGDQLAIFSPKPTVFLGVLAEL